MDRWHRHGVGFAEANSWVNFSGNLVLTNGSGFQTIRNGATAMGSGDLILGDARHRDHP